MRTFKNILRIKPRLRSYLKRIDIILCVETSVNTIPFYVFNKTKKPALAIAKRSTLMTVR